MAPPRLTRQGPVSGPSARPWPLVGSPSPTRDLRAAISRSMRVAGRSPHFAKPFPVGPSPVHGICAYARWIVLAVPRSCSRIQQQPFPGWQQGDEIPIKGHQAFAAGKNGGRYQAIADGIAHQDGAGGRAAPAGAIPRQLSAAQPIAAEQDGQHHLSGCQGGGFHEHPRMDAQKKEAGRHHRQQTQTLTQGSSW